MILRSPRSVRRRAVRRVLLLPLAVALSLVLATDAIAVSWTANRTVAGGGVAWASRGAMAASSSTLVHAVFEQEILGWWGVYYRRSTNSGSTWSTPIQLSSPSIGEAAAASVEAYSSSVDAVWLESDDALAGLDTVVMYRRSTNGGLTWGNGIILSPVTESAGPPRLARRGSVVVVAWTNQLNGRVYARVSTNGGASFASRVQLATTTQKYSGLYEAYPAVAIGSGIIYAAYYSTSKYLRIRRSTTNGASWKTATVLTSSGNGNAPSIAAYGSAAIVGYAARNSSGSDAWAVVKRTTDKGAHWSSAISLSSSSSYPSFSPVVSVRGSRWMAIYDRCTSNSCSYSDVYYRASTNLGRTWSTASKASVRKRRHGEPADVELATKTLVMYVDWNSAGSDVYVRQGS